MTCRIKRCYVHVLALHLDQIFSLGFRVSSCRAADAILPPACRSLSPQTAGRTRPPTRPGKLSGFSDVSQRNLSLRGDGVFPSLGGRTAAVAVAVSLPRSPPLPRPLLQILHSRPIPHSARPPAPARVESATDPSVRPPSPAAAAIAAPDNFSLSPSLVKSGRTDGPLVTSPTHPSTIPGPSLSEFCVLC